MIPFWSVVTRYRRDLSVCSLNSDKDVFKVSLWLQLRKCECLPKVDVEDPPVDVFAPRVLRVRADSESSSASSGSDATIQEAYEEHLEAADEDLRHQDF